MDISKWPLDKILQLPDSCFGARFTISFSVQLGVAGSTYLMSSLALPDRAILWEISARSQWILTPGGAASTIFALALGEKLATSATEFDAMEPLFPSVPEILGTTKVMRMPISLSQMRMPVHAQGRRVNAYLQNGGNDLVSLSVNLVFSAIPNEIPDLYEGHPKEQWDELIRLMRIGVKIR